MKKNSTILLIVWILFGSFSLLTPLLLTFYFETKYQSVNSLVKTFFKSEVVPIAENYFRSIQSNWPIYFADWVNQTFIPFLGEVIPVLAVLAIAGYIGYKISRVWLSWYLAVSLSFNGHNNEAGGLARIEHFKHILRIRLRDDKLTVFVIGIDDARPDLTQLKPKLVDKFDLEYS